MNESKVEFNKQRKNINNRVRAFEDSKAFLNLFFDDLPKQPSHYVRKDTNKFYLEQHFVTLKQLHSFYREVCDEKNEHYLWSSEHQASIRALLYHTTISRLDMTIGLFIPELGLLPLVQ
ncbi:unnamed protein product [Acanthoscelides obtectus]|uniref:Uncharacterized protein n=1 Tax=Acanthoscelides obtectus TaxID=200917 RepID=A0A9P0LAY3_ACAOB|nr:unnamed protein product [Acanthoscelides obtectus]CAK1662816.1 hypothetical protein AOBTE_LOCUS23331 [Acanthoscelides obtectus]